LLRSAKEELSQMKFEASGRAHPSYGVWYLVPRVNDLMIKCGLVMKSPKVWREKREAVHNMIRS